MKKILVFGIRDEEIPLINKWADRNEVQVDCTYYNLTNETVEMVDGYDGISISQVAELDPNLYNRLAEYGIKQIAQRSAGYEMHDLKEASDNGLIITNVPSYSPASIAEFAVMQALNLIRRTPLTQQKVAENDFRWQPEIRGRVINELTVAIIGVGRIGSRVASIYKGFGAKVVAYDIEPCKEFASLVEYQDSLIQAIELADIVTIHMPATELNYHQFDLELFKHFKAEAVLVNTARGPIVHTTDLFAALDQELVSAAALDVYENEAPFVPNDMRGQFLADPVYQQLISHPQIIYTPHVAYYTNTAVEQLIYIPLDSTLDIIQTGTTEHRLN